MNGNLRDRPEAPWALWSGIAGALAVAGLLLKGSFAAPGLSAVIGVLAVPLVAALAAIPLGIWGAAVGHVTLRLRGRLRGPRTVLVAALVVAASLPAFVAREVHRGLGLEAAVHEARVMDVRQLDAAFDRSPWRGDRHFVAALAQNPAASPELLARMAAEKDPELYEALGSLWDVMGENRKGLPVMRLVARHPNTRAETLARLAADADANVARDAELAIARRANPTSGAR